MSNDKNACIFIIGCTTYISCEEFACEDLMGLSVQSQGKKNKCTSAFPERSVRLPLTTIAPVNLNNPIQFYTATQVGADGIHIKHSHV